MGREMKSLGLLGSLEAQAHFLGPNIWVSTREKNSPIPKQNNPTKIKPKLRSPMFNKNPMLRKSPWPI